MPEIEGLVSIIIPVFNGEKYLKETLESIKKQTYTDWEIIIVNDGSTDGTQRIIETETDPRIRSVTQVNSGVSRARNNGLQNAEGEYVIFFDADDLMTSLFIEVRIRLLNENRQTGFVGGFVETFPQKTIIKKAVAQSPERQILFFDADFTTVPSNYMFRKEILIQKEVRFNDVLGSTADRFFLLQLARVANGKSLEIMEGKLLYRIDPQSMSHYVNPLLVRDNEKFYNELVKNNMLPTQNIAEFKTRYFYSLAGGFIKVRNFRLFLKYTWKSFFSFPVCFIKLIGKRAYKAFEK